MYGNAIQMKFCQVLINIEMTSADESVLRNKPTLILYVVTEKVWRYLTQITLFIFNKNVVFLARAEYSYFSADFRLKIFLYYS